MKRLFKALYVAVALLFVVFSTVCVLRITEYRKILNADETNITSSEETERGVIVSFSDGRQIELIFNNTAVKVVRAYEIEDKSEIYSVVRFIRRYAAEPGIEITRKNMDLYGELKLHNLLYSMDYKRESTADADLDYLRDKRWYVNVMSRLLG